MAIDVTFYQFNKNDNSTKIPTAGGTVIPCNLIEPTSAVNPSIALVMEGNPVAFNYARIAEFNRYYFINDWTFDRGRWVASMNCDVLASFKAEIGASTQYVLRSSDEYDGRITDQLYPATNTPTTMRVLDSAPLEGDWTYADFATGTFVVGIVNADPTAIGCVSYYAFSNSQFRTFCAALMGDYNWAFSGIKEIGAELFKSLFNPFQYVASCMWFPFPGAFLGVSQEVLHYGWWEFPVACRKLGDFTKVLAPVFDVPSHPQAARGTYLNGAPYSRYTLVWPAFGSFPLDANIVGHSNRLHADCWVDAVSGKGVLNVYAYGENGSSVALVTAQTAVGVPIQISQIASDYIGAFAASAGALGDVAKVAAGGSIADAASAIGNAVNSFAPKMQTTGANGMVTAFRFRPVLDCEFYDIVAENNDHRGRPLCQNRVIANIPGYIMCSDAELEIPGTAQELESVKAHLNGGFYYE